MLGGAWHARTLSQHCTSHPLLCSPSPPTPQNHADSGCTEHPSNRSVNRIYSRPLNEPTKQPTALTNQTNQPPTPTPRCWWTAATRTPPSACCHHRQHPQSSTPCSHRWVTVHQDHSQCVRPVKVHVAWLVQGAGNSGRNHRWRQYCPSCGLEHLHPVTQRTSSRLLQPRVLV